MHIGLFDSGVGGLTVLREIRQKFPSSPISYLGDTARLPYGNKAPQTLKQYTQENIAFLDQLHVDVIIIACHSASSVSLNIKHSQKGTPVINVIGPSCEEAIQSTKNKKIGVLATKATTRSQVYPEYIRQQAADIQVHSQEAPLLVPLVEEDYSNTQVAKIILEGYLRPLLDASIDTLILGCTHYPILAQEIQDCCGPNIQLIDPARSVIQSLVERQTAATNDQPKFDIYLTDQSPHFLEHAQKLLNLPDLPPIKALGPLTLKRQ
jgi:glutamate racemase